MIVCLASVIWFIILFKLQPITKHLEVKIDRNVLHHLWHTIKQKRYRTGFSATALLSIGGFMMMPWGSAFSINNLHITQQQLPILFMVGGVSSLIIMPMIGKLSDKFDKFTIFACASAWMIIFVLIYTHLTPVPFALVIVMQVLMMIGIMSRMVPSMALASALPQIQDRGAFMSINSSLQQISGGIAAAVGGLIVIQKDKFSPLQHYDTLGYVIVLISIAAVFMIYRVSKLVKQKK
jgi:predicted MFS family arabinose efflux permease